MILTDFTTAWTAFVATWSKERDRSEWSAARMIDRAVAEGLDAFGGLLAEQQAGSAVDPGAALDCEIAVLAASSLFDAQGYLCANPDVAASGMDPLRHYCRLGWTELRCPSSDFDVWWYWSEFLDPAQHACNPLLHYALAGRQQRLQTLPAATGTASRPVSALPQDRPIRRLCLLAGYDRDGLLDDHVVRYARELSRFADVYYLADCAMAAGELEKLDGIAKGAWAIRHGAYDFGSYSMLARDLVGWDVVDEYDEMILANDSCYLLKPLDEVFAKMSSRPCHWWGLQATAHQLTEDSVETYPVSLAAAKSAYMPQRIFTYKQFMHVGSYFLVYRREVTSHRGFRARLDAVAPQRTKINIIFKYETGFTRYLTSQGFDFSTFVDEVFPYHPVYGPWYFELVRRGYPMLKRQFLSENPYETPDLVAWKDRVLELVPDAPVEMFERNLLRTSPDDRLQRSFSIVTAEDGTVHVPRLLTGPEFAEGDRWAPKFDHWWAFPVCAYDHTFAGNDRAVFEAVREDPSIKKIVLTRSRRIEVDGDNVVVVPLASPEGQHYLLRSRQVFVKHAPRVNVPYPLAPELHNFINLWHGIPLKRFGHASLDTPARRAHAVAEHRRCRAVVTSSAIDTLSMVNAFHPLTFEHMWPTGLPRNDFVLCPEKQLPADLRAEQARLRDLVGDRRLVLFLPTFKDGQANSYYDFHPGELKWLAEWCERHHAVIGVREHMADTATSYSQTLGAIGALNLSAARFPNVEVLYREGAALISDYSSCLVDFTLTGRPVVSFAYDYDRYATEERGLFYDLDQVLPGPVARTFDQLTTALDHLFDPPTDTARRMYERRRGLFFDHLDHHNADRVVHRVKQLYR